MKSALVLLSSGIGNVVRWTPIIPILVEKGYAVDVWVVAPDFPEVAQLLAPSPLIRQVYVSQLLAKDEAPQEAYDLAIVSRWVPPFLLDHVQAVDRIECPRAFWEQYGDKGALVWTAVRLGYVDRIPRPFVHASPRTFELPSGTVAIHAGRKAGWEQKQWGGFGELLGYFPDFVLVGAGDDLSGHELGDYARYLTRGRDFVGRLSLADTAALLRECAAVVSIDSGIAHIAAALGRPTFAIYGITRPQRESFLLPNEYPIENRPACAKDCASLRYNARTCSKRIACLSSLTAADVAARVHNILQTEGRKHGVRETADRNDDG